MIKSIAKIILGSKYEFFRYRYQKYKDGIKHYLSIKKRKKNDAKIILSYRERFNPNIFIETGTYKGDVLNLVKKSFDEIYSIELGEKLYKKALQRFRKDKHIKLFLGDSGIVLSKILVDVNESVLFWLDAHYSKADTVCGDIPTPIEKELEIIFSHKIKNHVILIDDARCFTGNDGYPTVETISNLANMNGYSCEVKDDKFRLTSSCQ
ncbi:MAG: hypothetical protein AAB484_00570 [Patescibacteria group bacterium]|mgnify:CR=1 FL=1